MSYKVRVATWVLALGMASIAPHASSWAQSASSAVPAGSTVPAGAVTTSNTAPNGSLEKYQGKLRTSELVGANVYNDQGNSIGTVNDLLAGDNGQIQNAVLSVGGFLGVGTHYVSVPFDQLHIQPSRSGASTAGTPTATMNSHMASTAPTSTSSAAGNASPAPNAAPMGSVATTGKDVTSPQYFSLVLPDATKETLTKMPEYHYQG